MAANNKQLLYGIGGRIRDAREKSGLTLTDLSIAMGSEKASLHKIETGERIPKLETMAKLSDQLGISMLSLFCTDQSNRVEGMTNYMIAQQSRISKLSQSQLVALQGMIDHALTMAGV